LICTSYKVALYLCQTLKR